MLMLITHIHITDSSPIVSKRTPETLYCNAKLIDSLMKQTGTLQRAQPPRRLLAEGLGPSEGPGPGEGGDLFLSAPTVASLSWARA